MLRNGRSGTERFRVEKGLKSFVEVSSTRSISVPCLLDSEVVADSTEELSETRFVKIDLLLRVSDLLLLSAVSLLLLLLMLRILLSVLRLLMEVSLLEMGRVIRLRGRVLLELLLWVTTDGRREGFLIERRGSDCAELTR